MARNVVARPEVPGDFEALEPLWRELAALSGGSPSSADRARQRWEQNWRDADHTVIVTFDGAPAGMAAMSVQDIGAWTGRLLVITVMHVCASRRHKGVGQALLDAAADYALSHGVDAVAVDVPPAMRDANRFFARIGFAPLVTRRVISSTALKRRIEGESSGRMARLRARSAARRAARPGAVSP